MKFALLFLLAVPLLACTASRPATDSPSEPPAATSAATWAYRGTWVDSCCCKVSCPCLFGTGPTEGFCEGASVFEAEAAHYDGVRLDGLSAVVAYRVKGWTRIVVEDGASPAQVAAFGALVPQLLRFIDKGPPPTVTAGAVEVAREGGTIRYGTHETQVEITPVESATGGPIRLENLPAKGTPFPVAHEHIQYTSRRMTHRSSDGGFEWSGRNGFASKIDLRSGS